MILIETGKNAVYQEFFSKTRDYSQIEKIYAQLWVDFWQDLAYKQVLKDKWPKEHIAFGYSAVSNKKLKDLYDRYSPEIITRIGKMAKKVGGHGGMDFLMDGSMINSLRNGLPVDMDCYDAALWSCITPLSIKSVANRSDSICFRLPGSYYLQRILHHTLR